jgi:hypothetical protein
MGAGHSVIGEEMTITIRVSPEARDLLYQIGHGLGLRRSAGIMDYVLQEYSRLKGIEVDREQYIKLGEPLKLAKPLKGKRIARKCIRF